MSDEELLKVVEDIELKMVNEMSDEETHALERTIAQQIQNQPDTQPHHTLHFNMQAEGYTHAFQSITFSVKQFQEGSKWMQTYLQSLANKLNSGEKFNTNTNFETELTLICSR